MVVLGNERLFDSQFVRLIRDRRVGLITNHSGVDRRLRSTVDLLHAFPHCELAALYGPEHGIRGDAEDGVPVSGARDRITGVPVYSLYGETRAPLGDMLVGIDVMLFDIQDVGARFYTYLYTMSLSMEACAARGIPFVVLDRPDPLGGERVAGNVLDPAFASFVGRYPIPIQYGMTIGELALLFHGEFGLDVDLSIVPLAGWKRSMDWEGCAIPWVPPSPNMPTLETARAYPGTCFFEGTNLSEGRGTTQPFLQIGAPFVDGHRLAAELSRIDLPGALFRPVSFRPYSSKHQGQACEGVRIHVVTASTYAPVRTGLEVLAAVRRLWPEQFCWRTSSGDIYNFDRLAGTDTLRQQLDAEIPVREIVATWESDRQAFLQRRQRYLLYR